MFGAHSIFVISDTTLLLLVLIGEKLEIKSVVVAGLDLVKSNVIITFVILKLSSLNNL